MTTAATLPGGGAFSCLQEKSSGQINRAGVVRSSKTPLAWMAGGMEPWRIPVMIDPGRSDPPLEPAGGVSRWARRVRDDPERMPRRPARPRPPSTPAAACAEHEDAVGIEDEAAHPAECLPEPPIPRHPPMVGCPATARVEDRMGLLDGKTALIFGVANDHSIAWGIAQALHAEGAEVGFSSVESLIEKRVRPLATSVGRPSSSRRRQTMTDPNVFARWGGRYESLGIPSTRWRMRREDPRAVRRHRGRVRWRSMSRPTARRARARAVRSSARLVDHHASTTGPRRSSPTTT
jgi:hypothetical protein